MSITVYVWLKCVCSCCFLFVFDSVICETDLRQVLHTRICRFRFVSLCVKLLRVERWSGGVSEFSVECEVSGAWSGVWSGRWSGVGWSGMGGGRWSGEWRVESGEWRVESGEWSGEVPRNLRFEVHKVFSPATKSHKVLCLLRNLHFTKCCACHEICTSRCGTCHEIYTSKKVLCLPRNLHFEVHKVLRLPRNLTSRFTNCCGCHEICASRFTKC